MAFAKVHILVVWQLCSKLQNATRGVDSRSRIGAVGRVRIGFNSTGVQRALEKDFRKKSRNLWRFCGLFNCGVARISRRIHRVSVHADSLRRELDADAVRPVHRRTVLLGQELCEFDVFAVHRP